MNGLDDLWDAVETFRDVAVAEAECYGQQGYEEEDICDLRWFGWS